MPVVSQIQESFSSHSALFFRRSLFLLYFISGLTSLAYEVLWARMLSLQFGVSIFGVAITVSTFMLGLGLGSLVGARWFRRLGSPLKFFALFELGVAIMALLTPWLLQQLEPALALLAQVTDLGTWYALQFMAVAVILFIPAFLMGAGFPMVLRVVGVNHVGKVYGINTLGAALGALLPLLLLPTLGWVDAMRFVAICGAVVALCAWLLYSKSPVNQSAPVEQATVPGFDVASLITYAGIGAAAIILEVAWTRLFGMLLLRTEYVLALILAVFLLGMALGSLITHRLQHHIIGTALPLLVCSFGLAGLWLTPWLLNKMAVLEAESLPLAILQQGTAVVLLTLPVTLCLGAWLPWLTRKLRSNSTAGSMLYGANAVGGAVGGLLAAFVLTPTVGSSAAVVIASLMMLALGLRWSENRRAWLALPLFVLLAIPIWNMPSVSMLLPQAYAHSRDLAYREDAVNITHVVERESGERLLLADLQRMDASSDPTAVEVQKNQTRLPLLLHHYPKSVLFLGLGTGISAAGSLAYPDLQRTAVELSQGAIEAAASWFAPVNGDVSVYMNVVRDDARRFLMGSRQNYDVIIGDLFHPDLVGRSALLSVQQFQRAKQRLAEKGLFVQWLALNQFDKESLEIVLRSFQKVFPQAVLFADGFRVALVGRQDGPVNALEALNNMARLSEQQQYQVSGGEGVWTWLGRYWGPLALTEGVTQDEWAPQIEFKLPQARYNGQLDLAELLRYLLSVRPNMQQAQAQLQIPRAQLEAFERAYAATELSQRSWLAQLTGGAEQQRLLKFAYQANPKDRWVAYAIADGVMANAQQVVEVEKRQLLQSVLKIRPDHIGALKQLWQLEHAAGNTPVANKMLLDLKRINPFDTQLGKF